MNVTDMIDALLRDKLSFFEKAVQDMTKLSLQQVTACWSLKKRRKYRASMYCKKEQCDKIATYGIKGTRKAEYCKTHRPNNDYVDVKHPKCAYINGCATRPSFGKEGSKKAEYCADHAPKEYVEIASKKCIYTGCTTRPNYGKVGTRKAEYCVTHAPGDYVEVTSQKCIRTGCTTRAYFGKVGTRKAEYCVVHAPKGYVDVKHLRCLNSNCDIRPVYGKPGSKVAEYCFTHKLPGYVNVRKKQCKITECTRKATYGKKDTRITEYCAGHGHDLPGYIDVTRKKCKEPGCEARPFFGVRNSGVTEYCDKHRPADYVDVVSRKCRDCDNRAHYGYKGEKSDYCKTHATVGMVRLPYKYNLSTKTLCEYCSIDIERNQNFCSGCKRYIQLGTTVKRHEKELAIKSLLEENKIPFAHDLTVKGGVSKKRPDFLIQTAWGIIILEIDEFQHNRRTYSCACELTRMKQLYFDCVTKNVLFVRYNPDSYKPLTGKKETRPAREVYLIKFLSEQMASLNFKHLAVVYLFYDGFTTIQLESLDPSIHTVIKCNILFLSLLPHGVIKMNSFS